MRQLASFLLITLAIPAVAAETWRWKDENGVVHYSDRPVPGAELMDVGPEQAPGDAAAPAAPRATTPRRRQKPAEEFRYTECLVKTPANDETFNGVSTVDVELQIAPALRAGDLLHVTYDGKLYAEWPSGAMSHTLATVYRGTHVVSINVQNAEGGVMCTSPPVSFHVRQPSVLSPPRRPGPKR